MCAQVEVQRKPFPAALKCTLTEKGECGGAGGYSIKNVVYSLHPTNHLITTESTNATTAFFLVTIVLLGRSVQISPYYASNI